MIQPRSRNPRTTRRRGLQRPSHRYIVVHPTRPITTKCGRSDAASPKPKMYWTRSKNSVLMNRDDILRYPCITSVRVKPLPQSINFLRLNRYHATTIPSIREGVPVPIYTIPPYKIQAPFHIDQETRDVACTANRQRVRDSSTAFQGPR
jgi:hypothetical protein